MATRYGQRGGDGPNAGKTSTLFEVTLPDGTTHRKRAFISANGRELTATAFKGRDGAVHVGIWADGRVPWEGDYGRLVPRVVTTGAAK